MPTKKENNYDCGATYSGRFKGAHPKVGDGEVSRTVCFDRSPDKCRKTILISVKKFVDRTISTNFLKHHHVLTATVAQTECKTKD